MNENENQQSAMYVAATKLLEASRITLPYNPILSNVILLMSEAITTDIMNSRTVETDPEKSKRINKQSVEDIRNELGKMIDGVKKEIAEGVV